MVSPSEKEIDNNTALDPERQLQAKKYAKIQRSFMLVDIGLGALVLLGWLLLGWSAQLRDWVFSWTQNPWIAVLAFGFIFGGVFTMLDLPLSYYTGFILPHRFQQSNQSRREWIVDQLKSLLISAGLGAIVLEIIYLVLRIAPETWWLWTAGFLLLFNVLLANLAPILL
ncbi:MAG: hypothetical protein MUP11_12485, partial [Anaerolineales bacterium]|nr:hypothetical protein [Anaerolineales bacterium]